jgi:hypothetical protein
VSSLAGRAAKHSTAVHHAALTAPLPNMAPTETRDGEKKRTLKPKQPSEDAAPSEKKAKKVRDTVRVGGTGRDLSTLKRRALARAWVRVRGGGGHCVAPLTGAASGTTIAHRHSSMRGTMGT